MAAVSSRPAKPLLHQHRVAETEGQLEGRFKGLRAIHERHAEGRTLLAGLYHDLVAEGALHHSGSVLRRRFPGHHYISGHGKAHAARKQCLARVLSMAVTLAATPLPT